jgi:transcriptional regulator with XRE-family HTH domain
VSNRELLLPALTPAAKAALDPAFQFAYARLIASRMTAARQRLVEAHGDLYSQQRVARRLGKSQTWLSNLEVGQRRIDTSALLILCALYGVPQADLVMPAKGKREEERMTQWIREYRALVRGMESADRPRPALTPTVTAPARHGRPPR